MFLFSQFRSCFTSRCLILGIALGLLLCQLGLAQSIITVAGGNGSGAGANQLSNPSGVYVDGSGNIYVADRTNNRIQRFPPNSISATAGVTVAGGNGLGAGANQLNRPYGVFVDGLGNIYVADSGNDRIQRFPPNSSSATVGVTVAGGNGRGSTSTPSRFDDPSGVFVDGSGNLYVADSGNDRIQRFPPNSSSATAGVTVAGGNGIGDSDDQFFLPTSVFVDGSGNLYVADFGNDRIQRFLPNSSRSSKGLTVAGGNGLGAGANQLNRPFGVFGDGSGNLYVADFGNDRIQRFLPNSSRSSKGLTVAGGNGSGAGANQLNSPFGVFVGGDGKFLFVADAGNGRVQRHEITPPVIVSQPPASLSVCAGVTVTATVSATANNTSLTYQWYATDVPLSGQTSPTLTLANVQASNATNYYVVVTSTRNGVSTISTTFQLSVLITPTVSLEASGNLSATMPSVTLTASGGSSYQFGPGATQIGTGPTATVSTPGLYYVKVTGTNNCSEVASTTVSLAPSPDLTPLLYLLPTSLYGAKPVTVVVDVLELNGVASNGLLTLKITQDAMLNLSLPASATMMGSRPVNNSIWQLSGPADGYYTLSTSQAVPAGGQLSVGLTGNLSPDGSSGGLTVSGTLVGGSGGDVRPLNNTDAERLQYFQQ